MIQDRIFVLIVLILRFVSHTQAAAPVVSGLPTDIYVGEGETGSRLLYTYSIQDPNGDNFTCTNSIAGQLSGVAAADNNNEFQLKRNTNSGKYELWTTGAATFNVATIDTYVNRIQCTDSNGETSTPRVVNVILVDNEQVTINNVEGTTNDLTINALNTGQGVTVKTVSSTSTLGHTLRYSLVSNPSFTPEFFTIDSSTGAIKTNRALKYLDAATPTVYLTITAYDTNDQIQVYAVQTVTLTNQNTVPATTNMIGGLKQTKLETLAAGTVLFKVSVEDPDSAQTHTYRYTCSPVAGEDTFTLDSNGNFKIATGKTLDYESIPFFNCSFYIDDQIEEGGPFIYELTVANDNEAPTFSDTMYYATTTEAAKGAVSFDPKFTCTDQDAGDTTTYDFQPVNNSDRFSINSNGVMTFNTNYDVDNNAMPSSVVLTVYCIDSGHLDGVKKTGSAQVTITIADTNDNEPVFSAPSYTITVDQNTTPGSAIGTISPSDADSGSNADLTCTSLSTSTYSSYYTIGADCNIYLSKTIDFATGTQVRYAAYAVDDGSPKLTGTTAIDIIYRETTTTTTTTVSTTTAYNFFDHGENIALFVLSLLMGLALLGLLSWCLLRMCCGGGCGGRGMCGNMCDCRNQGRTRRYPRAITPESPPPRKRRPPSPIIQEEPKKIIQQQRPVQVVRTIARPMYGFNPYNPYSGGRALPPPQYVRTAPQLPGYFG